MRRLLLATALALVALAAVPSAAMAVRWHVTVENLVPVRDVPSQPLSPPGIVIHGERVDVWEPGRRASRAVWRIAEDGHTEDLLEAYREHRGVGLAAAPTTGFAPGDRRSFVVRAPRRYRHITILQMLGNTNDGFTGLDSVRLPRRGRVRFETLAWDAGSERNSESREFVPGPCCASLFSRDPERRRVRLHAGIAGRGDLVPEVHGWMGPVARYTIRRARPAR